RVDPWRADRLRTRAARACSDHRRPAPGRRMRTRLAAMAALVAGVCLLVTAAALADPATPPPAPTAPTGSITDPTTGSFDQPPTVGIQVGPPLPADAGGNGTGGQVNGGGAQKPAWWDIPGRVRYGI